MDRKIGLGIAFGFALGIAAPSFAQQAVQWRVEDGGNGHWYQLVISGPIAWDAAKQLAESRGGYLACIGSATENAFVTTVGSNPNGWTPVGTLLVGPWLGGFQAIGSSEPGGGWSWVSGEPWTFQNWTPPEPNDAYGCLCENWLHLLTQPPYAGISGYWNDAPLNDGYIKSYVVEWSADCNADGIVDYGQCRDGSLPDYDGDNIPDCCDAGTPCTVGNYPVQWRVEEGGNGHWYEPARATDYLTWSQAQVWCHAEGASLASLGTQAESDWVYATLASNPRYWVNYGPYIVGPWIGGRGPSGNWRWDDGSPWGFAAWYPGEGPPSPDPVEQFAHYFAGVGPVVPANAWGDYFDVPVTPSYVAEWSADCNGDGLVDYGQILDGTLEDVDSNGVPDICEIGPCPGDINDSGVVNGIDLAAILAYWGTDGGKFPRTDANDDGIVDANDLAIVLSGWGNCP